MSTLAFVRGRWILLFLVVATVSAQEQPAPAGDPRTALKGGFRDAGTTIRNLELIASLPRPEGFFDPKAPGGLPTPAEESREEEEAIRQKDRELERAGLPIPPRPGA